MLKPSPRLKELSNLASCDSYECNLWESAKTISQGNKDS